MAAIVEPDLEEKYLLALLEDESGLDIAEWCWVDEEREDGCWRAWDFQWPWYRCKDPLQIDQCGRAVGKTNGIEMRAFAFPFCYPGQEMLITAPELNHLRPIVDKVEARIKSRRFSNEMRPKDGRGGGISRQPQWQVRFTNGARILSRLPNKDGKGVKGIHAACIELDEGQDFPLAGWTEIVESRNSWAVNSYMRVHGVSKGVRDKYYEMTMPESGFTVHRYQAMYRPSWSAAERQARLNQYGGSRNSPDYRRNVYGEHGDATNPMFVLARLTACIDLDPGSEYMQDVYTPIQIQGEQVFSDDTPGNPAIEYFLDLPGTHRAGWSDVKAGYSVFYGGMDVGLTIAPSEILIFGQRPRSEQLDLLTRVQLRRIHTDDQKAVIRWLFDFYGPKLHAFGIDAGGLGFPIFQSMRREPGIGKRIHGWKFNEKVITGFEDRPLEKGETMEDLAILREFVEHASDLLRNEYVDPKRILLPDDREIINQFQGQTYTVVKSSGSPYGKRNYSEGQFHALDAARMAVGARHIPPLEQRMNEIPQQDAVLDVFVGAAWP